MNLLPLSMVVILIIHTKQLFIMRLRGQVLLDMPVNAHYLWRFQSFRTFRFARHHRHTLVFLSRETRDVAVRDSGDK